VCILGSVTILLAFLLAGGTYAMISVGYEERRRMAGFGDAYTRYRRAVPRLWPRPAGFQSPGNLFVAASRLRPELWRTLFWVWLPVVAKVLAQLRAETWWPKILGLT
jgi:hypothetical protein